MFYSEARAEKIIFNLKGEQSIVEVGERGDVTKDAEIVWRERDHGPIPVNSHIGFAERWSEEVEKTRMTCDRESKEKECVPVEEKYMETVYHLRENLELKAAKLAKDAAKANKDATDAQDKSDFAALKAKINAETASAVEIRKAFKLLLKKLGE